MANDVDLSQLIIEVDAKADNAGKNIDSVASALSRLNEGSKLTRTISSLTKLKGALDKFQNLTGASQVLKSVSDSMKLLSEMPKLSNLNSAINAIRKIPDAFGKLDTSAINSFIVALYPLLNAMDTLRSVDKLSGLNSAVNALRKIPKVTESLNSADLLKFADAVEKVRVAIAPLAAEMDKVSKGFSSLPANIRKAIAANEKLTSSNKKASSSFSFLGIRIPKVSRDLALFGISIYTVSDYLGAALENFNSFVENVNLFSVSMGSFADTAASFTEALQNILGVDASEAMRNMGIIQNLVTSFGMASDTAYVLSKNITQLGYDFASFFNISTEEAFTKLQAALSGELEPIRRLGVDISEARLQQELYALGIDATVESLNQADKAQLRYIAIMKQTVNAQTDMARTLNSPANMIRVFQAQLTLLARSIGSLLIPMLNAILPPLIAAIQILREFITSVASLFGVSVAFADMGSSISNLGASVGSAEDLTDAVSDVGSAAGSAAKEMDYLIGGFDELNVMNKDAASGSGVGSDLADNLAGAGSVLEGVELPTYDIFSGLVDSQVKNVTEKVKGFLKEVKRIYEAISPMIKGILVGIVPILGAIFAPKIFKKIDDWLDKIGFSLADATDWLWGFFDAFDETGSVVKAAKSSLSSFRSSLSVTTKAIGGATGFTAVATTAYNAVKDWQTGIISAGQALGNIAIVAGLAGAALYVMLGPVGLVITAFGVLAGAVAGAIAAENELRAQGFQASFYDGVGTSITQVSDAYVKVFDAVATSKDAILETQSSIGTSQDLIKSTASELQNLASQISFGGTTAKAVLPEIQQAFSTLETETKSVLDRVSQNIMAALAGSLGDTLEQMGYQIPEIASQIQGITQDAYEQLESLQTELDDLFAAYDAGSITDTAFAESFANLSDQIYSLTNESLPEVVGFNSYMSDEFLKNINFESPEAFNTAMDNMSTAASDAKTAIKEAGDAIVADLEVLRNSLSDPSKVNFVDTLIQAQQADVVRQQNEIDDTMRTVAEAIQTSFTSHMESLAKSTAPSAWQLFLSTFAGGDALAGMINDEILSGFSGLDDKFKSTFAEYGDYSLTGYAEGILKNKNVVSTATQQWTKLVDSTARANLGIHSPSTLFESFGRYSMSGFGQGITNNLPYSVSALQSFGQSVLSELTSIMQSLRNAVAGGVVISVVTEYSTRGTPSEYSPAAPSGVRGLSIPAFASGGVLTDPHIILAGEYPNAKSNPEIVSPQSLMRATVADANSEMAAQIVAAIRALEQTIVNLDAESADPVVNVNIGDDQVYQANRRAASKRGYPIGLNPKFE